MALQRFPGFIDAHVHLREPGATQKEDFYTGSRAAVKGGVTFVIDMPNNPTPTVTVQRLEEKFELSSKAVCDVGFHFGTNGTNLEEFPAAAANPRVYGLKLYCNHTTGEMLVEDPVLLEGVFKAWPVGKPILLHAEGEQLAMALVLAKTHGQRVHVCHITLPSEVEMVREAKAAGQAVTAGVCPHHLFMTAADRERMKGYATMKPPLGPQSEVDALWEGLRDGTIDIVETDHAPHTKEDKEKEPPAYGVPGLETSLGLMLKAAHEGKIALSDVTQWMYLNPKKIFNIPDQVDTYVELDPEKPYTAGEDGYESKCGWSPFDGWTLYGKPETVVINGKTVVEHGKVVA